MQITWFLPADSGKVYRLAEDVRPKAFWVRCPKGNKDVIVDVLADGVSIFARQPRLIAQRTEDIFDGKDLKKGNLRAGAILSLEVTSGRGQTSAQLDVE